MSRREQKQEMSFEEAVAFKASLYKPEKKSLSLREKREQFRIFWAKSRKKYPTKAEKIEQVIWLHLVATKNDDPENFEQGLKNFGLKGIKGA